jgi:hypothetical protein
MLVPDESHLANIADAGLPAAGNLEI